MQDPAVRSLARVRWLLPALLVPVGITALGVGIQVAAFRRPPASALLVTDALRVLLRYRVIRGTEEFTARRVASVCVQGWFRTPRHRRFVRGAIVLLGTGERLYDFGDGIRVFRAGRAGQADRVEFLLAGCPRVLAQRLGARLIRATPMTRTARIDGQAAVGIGVGRRSSLELYVSRGDYAPLALTLVGGAGRGRSDLEPGGSSELVVRVRHAFGLPPQAGRRPHA